MGRKPVLAVAGSLLASLALAGCQTTTTKDPFLPTPKSANLQTQTTYAPTNNGQPAPGPNPPPNNVSTLNGGPTAPIATPPANTNSGTTARAPLAAPGSFQMPGQPTPASGTTASGLPNIPSPPGSTNLNSPAPSLSIPSGNTSASQSWPNTYTPTSMNGGGPALGNPPATNTAFIANGSSLSPAGPNLAPAGGVLSQGANSSPVQMASPSPSPSPYMQPAPQLLGGGQPMAPSAFGSPSQVGGASPDAIRNTVYPPSVPSLPQGASYSPPYVPQAPAGAQQGFRTP